MPKVTTVTRSRARMNGTDRVCNRCGRIITPGDPYRWVSLMRGGRGHRQERCLTCPTWRPSELTTGYRSELLAIQEAFEDAAARMARPQSIDEYGPCTDEIEVAYDEARDAALDIIDRYRESAENVEEGFGHPTTFSEWLAERADELEALVSYDLGIEHPGDTDPAEAFDTVLAEVSDMVASWTE